MKWIVLMLTVAIAGAPAGAAELHGTIQVRFAASSTLHDFDGVAPPVDYVAKQEPDGGWNASIAVPVDLLDTGNALRDSNMRKMLDAEHYPTIGGSLHGVRVETLRAAEPTPLEIELTIRDVTRRLQVPASNWRESADGKATFELSFEISLHQFGLEPPSILFVEVADGVHVDIRVSGSIGPPAHADRSAETVEEETSG